MAMVTDAPDVNPPVMELPFEPECEGRFQLRSIEPAFALEELAHVAFDASYRQQASIKFHPLVIKAHGLVAPAMNILKQECVGLGAEAGVHREAITCKMEDGPVLITATESQLRKLIPRLRYQPFALSKLAVSLERFLERRALRETYKPAQLMAVLNCTPDSFSDGGQWTSVDDLVTHAQAAVSQGATILDIGGESTRPGAQAIADDEELKRVLPVIKALKSALPSTTLSIDTRKAMVASAALKAGAHWVNDVSAGTYDPDMIRVVKDAQCPWVLMHAQGTPDTMQDNPQYTDVVGDVATFFYQRIEAAVQAGIDPVRLMLDPGFGFGKTRDHNLVLMRRLPELVSIGLPVVVGTSRKQFLTLGKPDSIPVESREALTAASIAWAVQSGASIIRVHDVQTHAPVLAWANAVATAGGK